MTSYLENKLELLNASQRKLDEEKHAIEEQIILEIKKKSALEMDGTIVKFETQLNELKKYIEGDILPNNIEIVVNQYNKDYNDGCNKLILKRQSGELSNEETNNKATILRQKLETVNNKYKRLNSRAGLKSGYDIIDDRSKNITLKEFKNNLCIVDEDVKFNKLNSIKLDYIRNKRLYEIKPEIKIYDDIIPIFSTMIGIMKKQQEEIKELQSKHKSSYIIPGVVH